MRKTDKKLDNQLRISLTSVCDNALKEFTGFEWLTHVVNYTDFPNSLKVVCVFDTNENLKHFMLMNNHTTLNALIQKEMSTIGVNLTRMNKHVSYDTEENCDKNNNGKWADRLAI